MTIDEAIRRTVSDFAREEMERQERIVEANKGRLNQGNQAINKNIISVLHKNHIDELHFKDKTTWVFVVLFG